MATQTALLVQEIGKPLVLVHDRAVKEPGQGQVLIKVSVCGLNPHDQRSRDWGLLIDDKLPAVLGKDVVGTVTQLGSGVEAFRVGDRVMSLGSGTVADHSQSGLQEYALADVVNCARVPEGLSDEEAATLPTNISAAFAALFVTLGLPSPWTTEDPAPADNLLIIGGGSNCGKFAVQLAALSRIQNIVVVGGDEALLKKLGATHVISRHDDEGTVVRNVRQVVGDDLQYVFDAVNFPDGLGVAIKALSDQRKGKLARLVPMGKVEDSRGHEVYDVLGNLLYRTPLVMELWERLEGLVKDGSIVPTTYSTREGLKADVVNAALDEYRDGKNKDKPVIRF